MTKKMLSSATLVAVLLLASCAGTKAREHTLWPGIRSSWPAIMEQIDRGLQNMSINPQTTAAINQIEGAVRADDWQLLAGNPWFALEPIAQRGIQSRQLAGEISAGIAVSLRERIKKFTEAMLEITKP